MLPELLWLRLQGAPLQPPGFCCKTLLFCCPGFGCKSPFSSRLGFCRRVRVFCFLVSAASRNSSAALASAARRASSAASASAASRRSSAALASAARRAPSATWFQLQGAIFCRLDFCSMPLSCRYSPRGPWNYAVVHVKFLEACLRQRTRVVDALEKRSLSMVACTAASIFSLSPPLSLFFSLSSFRVLHIMEQ